MKWAGNFPEFPSGSYTHPLTELYASIPEDIIKFVLVVIFSLLIGMEQRRHAIQKKLETVFGTDRTFTLIGILGFVLYRISPANLWLFGGGGLVIASFLGLYYLRKMDTRKQFGMTSMVIALITYCLAPLIYTQSSFLVLFIVVVVLILTEIKKSLFAFSTRLDDDEFITLAKFLGIAGVILPLLPDEAISPLIPISPYKFWLAIVAVSGISYLSYLLKKFVFPESGLLLTGILGGLYSSTATTAILARRSKESPHDLRITAAILLATAMMYLRIFLLALFFNEPLALQLGPAFALLFILSVLLALIFNHIHADKQSLPAVSTLEKSDTNPLEFRTALLFGALFIFFSLVTEYIHIHYGADGLNLLSFVVGVTDIDPFIINLLQSHYALADSILVMAIVNATTSNNVLKMIYGVSLSEKSLHRSLIIGFSVLVVTGLVISFIFLS